MRYHKWLNLVDLWAGNSIEESLLPWFQAHKLKKYRAIPYLVLWGVWLAQNALIFEKGISIQFRLQHK
jgi:hypothetical protein